MTPDHDTPAPAATTSPVTSRAGSLLVIPLVPEQAAALLHLVGRPVDDHTPDPATVETVANRVAAALPGAPMLGGDPALTVGDLDAVELPSRDQVVAGPGAAAARMVVDHLRAKGGTEAIGWALAIGYLAGLLARAVLHGEGAEEYGAGLARMILLAQAEHDHALGGHGPVG